MKLKLRITLLAIMLVLVGFTVAGLGLSSYWNVRTTADDLSRQILEQTSLRIDAQINELLRTANRQGDLNRRLLESGQLSRQNFARLAPFWLEQMRVHPKLVRLSLGLEATGEWYYVRRVREQLALGELRRNGQTGKLELRDYWPEQYPQQPFFTDRNQDAEDPRARPWYTAARQAGKQAWSASYLLFGVEGVADVPGVSCATPVYAADQTLLGVVTASFSLEGLCSYLRKLSIGQSGYAFVIEYRTDGSRRIIAHPDHHLLLRTVGKSSAQVQQEVAAPEELADERVRAFLQQLPDDLDPTLLPGIHRISFQQEGVPYLGTYACLSTQETPDWLICTIMPKEDVFGRVDDHQRRCVFLGLCVLAVAVLASLCITGQVAGPLELLARETSAIGHLQLEARPKVRSVVQEVDRLASAMEEMKTGLRSFQKYVPSDLVQSLLAEGAEARLGGELRTMTIYFCDIANFTSISEALTPEQLVEQLGEYLSTLSGQIFATGGTVDKYLGDGIMAFWGAPALNAQHAVAACTAAVRNREQMIVLRQRWACADKPPFQVRMGLHTGAVVVGNIGSDARLNYTVIGDAVNLASRLEGLNKVYGTEILISENTYREARQAVVARPIDWVSVKGKSEAVLVYELLGLHGEASAALEPLVERYSLALNHYRKQDWDGAIRLFEEVLRCRAADAAAQEMIARCQRYRANPPGADWDGVHRMASK